MYIIDSIWIYIKRFLFVPHYVALKNFRNIVLPTIPRYIQLLIIPRKKVIFCSNRNKFIILTKKIEYLRHMNCNYSVVTTR